MTGSLSTEQTERFARDGFLAPVDVLNEADAASMRERLEAIEASAPADLPIADFRRTAAHVVFTPVDELVHDARIVDVMESLIGPDILLWDSDLIIKEPNTPGFISWHQDLRYMGIEPLESFTAWLALSPATGDMGCMRFLPGSHRRGLLEHVDTHADTNLLTRGQTVRDGIDETQAVAGPLMAGQMSIHHGLALHASEPNRSDHRRIGLAMRFLAPSARQTKGERDYASLVRGSDHEGNFLAMPRPQGDLMPEAVAAWRKISDEQSAYYFEGGDATWSGGTGTAGR
ncbi:MAG: phytanoyl-CoA dioxygenase family protein [Pseudomonadota bacterium]